MTTSIDLAQLGIEWTRYGSLFDQATGLPSGWGFLFDRIEVAPGVALRFIHRPLSRYVHALGEAGLLIDDMCEPAPPARLLADEWGFAEAATIPRVLLLRARRAPLSRPG